MISSLAPSGPAEAGPQDASAAPTDGVAQTTAPSEVIPILLVEDQLVIGIVVKRVLSGDPRFQLHHCLKATDALEWARRIKPLVILQDLTLSDGDGIDLLHSYRACAEIGNTPVIVLSATDDAEAKKHAFEAGADDYVVKMPQPVEMLARVRRHAKSRQAEIEMAAIEDHVRQTGKMEAVGQLAAGLAHEINTPIQYIGDNTRFLESSCADVFGAFEKITELLEAARVGPVPAALLAEVEKTLQAADIDYLKEEMPKAISQTLNGVARVAKIVRAMKEFSHPSGGSKEPADVSHLIENTLLVSSNEWKYVAEVKTEFDASLPKVPCFVDELNQALLNMVVNAAHAIASATEDGAKGKGVITISTRRKGDWAEIRIKDTGTGIPEGNRRKIFDAFFTTKPVGKGTGQGLAFAQAVIVKKHCGSLSFETEEGKGTTFIIRLPLGGSALSTWSGSPPAFATFIVRLPLGDSAPGAH